MENFWAKAKTFAEEAAKRSQAITAAATTSPSKIADIVSETAKRSKDIAAEASKKAEELRTAALSLADQIPSTLSEIANSSSAASAAAAFVTATTDAPPPSDLELEKFGITDDLRDFVKGLTISTFQNFPIQDDAAATDVATVSNVRQDLSEWQQKHANLVLTTVKEVSKLRYELCPRHMKDRRFWRVYFTLVSTHVAAYERKYVEECKLQKEEEMKADKVEPTPVGGQEVVGGKLKSRSSTASTEQELDSFLLGDLDESDGHPDDDGGDDGDDNFDDDFDKIDNSEIDDGK